MDSPENTIWVVVKRDVARSPVLWSAVCLILLCVGIASGILMQYKGYGVQEKPVAAESGEVQRLQQEKSLLMNELKRLQARLDGTQVPVVPAPTQTTKPKTTPKVEVRSSFSKANQAHTAP